MNTNTQIVGPATACSRARALTSALALLLVTALAATGPLAGSAAAQGQVVLPLRFAGDPLPLGPVLDNGLVALDFDVSGTELLLRRITPADPSLSPVVMAPGSGGWSVRLARPGSAPVEWMQVSMDGGVDAGPGVTPGTLDTLTLLGVRVPEPEPTGSAQQILAAWRGRVTWDGASSDFLVQTVWRLAPGQMFARTHISVRLLESGPLPWYLARVVHPEVEVEAFPGATDEVLVPFVTGSLVRDPTAPGHPFPDWLGEEGNYYPMSVAAYSDGLPAATSFLFTADAGDESWKDLLITARADAGNQPGSVGFAMSHLPDDIYATRHYVTPYATLLGVVAGDWWAVADSYRDLLRDFVPWYTGPVGSPHNPMPPQVKDLVAEVLFQPGFAGDHMDMLNQQMMNLQRVLGSNVTTTWYLWHAPDAFDALLLEGYLPGRPSLGGSLREAQKQFDHKVSPYYNGGLGVDYTDPWFDPPISDPTPLQQNVFDGFLIEEDGTPLYLNVTPSSPRLGYLCSGDAWWQGFMPGDVADVAEFTDMEGVYLDVFLTGPCFATDHDHRPGGGAWMNTGRMDQLAALKSQLAGVDPAPEDFVVSMEFVVGRFSEQVHLMHHDPSDNLLGLLRPGTPGNAPIANAVTVPFFRVVYDNVKLSRITTDIPDVTGRRAWTLANNVFPFGQIPDVTRPAPELIPLFSQRFAIAPFFSFPTISADNTNPFLGGGAVDDGGAGGAAGGGAGDTGLGQGTSPGDIFDTVPHVNAFNTPYYDYLGSITTALRGDIGSLGHGQFAFRIWHNGTVRPLPPHGITQVGGPAFDGIPGVELFPDPQTPYEATPVYTEQYPVVSPDPYPNPIGPYIVSGMFRAPLDLPNGDAGSLAYIATNPWIDPTQTADFQLQFAVTPSDDPGWPGGPDTPYTVWRYDANGTAPQFLGTTTGTFQHSEVLTRGDIVWWVFRP